MKTWFLPACIVVFASISLITIGGVRPDLLAKQALFFLIGTVVYFGASRLPFTRWLEYRWWLYGSAIVLLTIPLLLGHSSRNTSRWIEFGFLNLQPSQLAIPLIGLTSVWLLAQSKRLSFKHISLFLLSLLPPMVLIFIAPDLGTMVVFASSLLILIWFAGASIRQLTLLALIGCSLMVISWILILKPYQRERMLSFLAGTQREEEQHYNATQALIAVGGGQIRGTGWGRGTQAHLLFLPEPQTDFIFSTYAQEVGFVGTTLLLILIALITVGLFHFARQTNEKTAYLYLILTAITLSLQAGINIGMNIGLLPITGVTLPLISYGGSSILATCLMLGISGAILTDQGAPPLKILT